jgi:hypothetical protein
MQYVIPFTLKNTSNIFTFKHDVHVFFSQVSHWNANDTSPGVSLIQKAQFFSSSFKDSADFDSYFLLMHQNPRQQLQMHHSHVQPLAQTLAN